MLVVKVDVLHPEPLQARLARPLHILRPPIHAQELAVGPANVPELGGEDQLVAATADGAPNQFLVLPDAVHIRGIEEIDPQGERAMDGGDRFRFV